MANDSPIIEKLAEIKDAFDEYFRKLSLGELIEPPLKQIEELPEMDEVGKELEKLAASAFRRRMKIPSRQRLRQCGRSMIRRGCME